MSFCVRGGVSTKWIDILTMLCLSTQVNIGEPSLPIQLAQRGKARIVPSGCDLVVGDCDFRVCNLALGVKLLTNIKSHPNANGGLPSLYKGKFIVLQCINIYDIDLVVDYDVCLCELRCSNCPCLP